jgi:hypothetical protein
MLSRCRSMGLRPPPTYILWESSDTDRVSSYALVLSAYVEAAGSLIAGVAVMRHRPVSSDVKETK